MARSFVPSVPRNGAVLVKRTADVDLAFLTALSDGVQAAARSQEAAGEDVDDVEFSPVQGVYDWRAYLQEEFLYARNRVLRLEASE